MQKANTAYILYLSIVAALAGLLFGYDTAVISGAIGFLQDHFNLSSAYKGWGASSALLGCVFGVGIAGIVSDRLGRKTTLVISVLLLLVSAIGSALSETFLQFVIFRIIGGLGVGAAFMSTPMYIAKISPSAIQGKLVSINQFAIIFGMLVVYYVNYFIASQGAAFFFQSIGFWALIFILGFIACFAVCLGPVTWAVLSEIFPTHLCGHALGTATFFLWSANFVVSQTFPILNGNPWLEEQFNHASPFWNYAMMCVITILFVWIFIPETKGKSLEEIEQMWKERFGLFQSKTYGYSKISKFTKLLKSDI